MQAIQDQFIMRSFLFLTLSFILLSLFCNRIVDCLSTGRICTLSPRPHPLSLTLLIENFPGIPDQELVDIQKYLEIGAMLEPKIGWLKQTTKKIG